MVNKIVIGTRGSELARAQARLVEQALREKWPDLSIETKIVRTKADESRSRSGASPHGRKGLFTAEIERALLAGDVDLAVHSAKDLPSELTAGTEIAAVLPRAPVADSRPINGTPSSSREPDWSGLVSSQRRSVFVLKRVNFSSKFCLKNFFC